MDARHADGGHSGPPRHTIQRLVVRASLDDPGEELERARRAADEGDSSWQQWLHEYHRGEALIARLDLRVDIECERSGSDDVEVHNRGIWLELRADPPLVEAQVAELACKDFGALARDLGERGVDLGDAGLHQMYVHVELAEDLRASLREAPAAGEQRSGTSPPASRIGDTPP